MVWREALPPAAVLRGHSVFAAPRSDAWTPSGSGRDPAPAALVGALAAQLLAQARTASRSPQCEASTPTAAPQGYALGSPSGSGRDPVPAALRS